jgi:predicted phosphoadenosine phosphosulfate sulfurtransferase
MEPAGARSYKDVTDIELYPWDWENQFMTQLTGLRAQESPRRAFGINASKGHLSAPDSRTQIRYSRPIYDWKDDDVWLALKKFQWNYCRSYDELFKLGVSKRHLRTAPLTLGPQSYEAIVSVRKLWPDWYERLCARLPGVRHVFTHGKQVLLPAPKPGEAWSDCYRRVCLNSPVSWIRERALQAMTCVLELHAKHSTLPFPESEACFFCDRQLIASWKQLTLALYNGDPACLKAKRLKLPPVDPHTLRQMIPLLPPTTASPKASRSSRRRR